MVSVFVSHSKDDVMIRKFFSEIFTNIGLKAKFMEWTDLTGKYAGDTISKIIRAGFFSGHDTSALFILLGKGVVNPQSPTPQFTHNWISFEAGAAASCLKPVWVFEEFSDSIKFPIPFVTDYVNYNIDNVEHLRFLSQLFKQEIQYPTRAKSIKPHSKIQCPYEDCNAICNYWNDHDKFNCPVCRRGITIGPSEQK